MGPTKPETVSTYSRTQVATRLGQLVFQVRAAAAKSDADTIHDLRVAIRRFGQSLTVFASLFPAAEARRIRRRLRKALDLAGAVRDRDIALEFLDAAGVPGEDRIRKQLIADRKKAERRLITQIRKWSRTDFSARWRADLQLAK